MYECEVCGAEMEDIFSDCNCDGYYDEDDIGYYDEEDDLDES